MLIPKLPFTLQSEMENLKMLEKEAAKIDAEFDSKIDALKQERERQRKTLQDLIVLSQSLIIKLTNENNFRA